MSTNNGNIEDIRELVRTRSQLLPRGGHTKTGLAPSPGITPVNISGIEGVLEYQADEYTFTAYAGTRLDSINQMLAENNQFMPFDPPFLNQGATLGGTVAANLSGPGRYRYGGVRDFILGVKFLDSQARLIRSGGKVVKNAAGFDISKLMVGSLGSLGALIEISFKVFPKPEKFTTLIGKYSSLNEGLKVLVDLSASAMELYCLEIQPSKDVYELRVRIGGEPKLLPKRANRIKEFMGDVALIDGDDEQKSWDEMTEFSWLPQKSILIKVPITPSRVPDLDEYLAQNGSIRRYSTGANLAWIAWSKSIDLIDSYLKESNLVGLTILGDTEKKQLGTWDHDSFYKRIKIALDPIGKWAEV